MESRFVFVPSKFIAVILTTAGLLLALGAWSIIAIPTIGRVLLIALLISIFVIAIRRHALLRGARAVLGISFLPAGNIELTLNNGPQYGTLSHYYLSPILTIFVVRGVGKSWSIMAACDSMDAEAHRKLRINLRLATVRPDKNPPR